MVVYTLFIDQMKPIAWHRMWLSDSVNQSRSISGISGISETCTHLLPKL